MPKTLLALAVLWLGWGGQVAELFAATNAAPSPAREYNIKVWDTDNGGLPQSSVIALTQTRDGYLWVGTFGGGLARFDGNRFEVFNEGNTPGLNSSVIVYLFEDNQGGLWVGTDNAGVVLVKNGKVTNFKIGRGGREGNLVAACEDKTGVVWLYTADGHLGRYQNEKMEVAQVGPGRSSRGRALIAEKDGLVWIGTDERLRGVQPGAAFAGSELPVAETLEVAQLDFLLASARGGYWRLAGGRVQKWRGDKLEQDWGAYPWRADALVSSACEDLEGNLIVGTRGDGIFWYNPEGTATQISSDNGLSHATILSVCVDHEGNLWVGTDGGGLDRVKRPLFHVLEESRRFTPRSVCEDAAGGLFIGSFGGGLKYWHDDALRQLGAEQGLEHLYIGSVFVDKDQQTWVGAYGIGLLQYDNGLFRPAVGAETLNRDVSAIFQDRRGRLWVGTRGGLAVWAAERWTVLTTREGLGADDVRALAEDGDGNLWIGTRGGLSRLRDGQLTTYHRQTNGLPSDAISALLVDSAGVLWIGTAGSGLARFHNGQWTHYTKRAGLNGDDIAYLIEDGEGYLWIGSNAGLTRVARAALNDFAEGQSKTVSSRAFGKLDGLPTREASAGSQPAAWRTRAGILWFPTTKGLVSVNPAQLFVNTNPPPVLIEAVLVDGEPQNPDRLRANGLAAITIPAGKERLDIHFTSLNLAAPEQARFRYRLDGHETAWTEVARSEVGSTPTVRYPKLPPGDYRFEVTAANEDGVWNDAGSSLAITVLPPFWRTWWFLTLTVAVLVGLIVAVVHYISTQKLQRQLATMRQHEALEKERARIARDLHDQLGANLTQLALLGELAESDKHLPDEVESHARQISQTAGDTARAFDEIVWSANPSNDTLDGLITYACKYAQEYLALAGLRYRLDVPAQLPTTNLPPEVRHNVFLAFKEAVNNVVKHAQATEAKIRLRLEADRFTLEVEDNGRGPGDAATKTGRNGLRNMNQRMEDVGGAFGMSPGPEGGTLIRLTAPFGK